LDNIVNVKKMIDKQTELREILDLNEYKFYSYMPDTITKRTNLGYFLKNKVLETYSYIAPTIEGEKDFESFLSYAFSFFSGGNEYFILKLPLNKYFRKNSKIVRNKGFISAFFNVAVMYWEKAKEKLIPNPALRLEYLTEKKINLWLDVFFDAFNYPRSIRNYIGEMVTTQINSGVEFYIAKVSDKVVSCFCAYNDGNIVGIYGVGTKKRYQRRGYATAMLSNYINELAKKDDNIKFCLQVQSNTAAERVYTKIGFEKAFIQKRFDWNPYIRKQS